MPPQFGSTNKMYFFHTHHKKRWFPTYHFNKDMFVTKTEQDSGDFSMDIFCPQRATSSTVATCWIFFGIPFFADAKVQTAGISSSWLAIFKCRRGSAVTLLGISKCRRGSADRGWLFLSADAKVQTLALSLSSLDYAHISSSDTFRFWNWALASSKTQSDKPEVT